MSSTSSQLSLARFAHNIYGSLGAERPSTRGPDPTPKPRTSKKLTYTFDREVTCILQLRHPLGRLSSAFYDPTSYVPSHHVIIGGRNYLKLLALDSDQLEVVADVNLIDPKTVSLLRLHASLKLVHVNTIKCNGDLVACGLTSGNVNIYQVAGNGKAKLAYRLDDHKRVVNSLDFVEQEQLLFSGSQDGTVKLWDLRSFQLRPVAKLMASQHSDSVRSCQYSSHSKVRGKMTILSAHDSGALCKFDLRYPLASHTSNSLPEKKWTFHTGPALSLHIHPELEYVLTGGRDRKICAWNYGESAVSMAPEAVVSTYGPVMKIRWNEMANDEPMDIESLLPLFNYDFACLYLNDDPSITVYNLARRFVPKEIVTTLSHKPFQNFIWAKGSAGARKLWTITKSNMFVSYDLDSLNGYQSNIIRPYEALPPVATAWGSGYSNLLLVAQESSDYDLLLPDYDYLEHEAEEVRDYTSPVSEAHSLQKGASNSQSFVNMKSTLFKDRPALLRLATQFSQSKLPRPISTELHGVSRPPLARNPSQSTEDSLSLGITMLPKRDHEKLDQKLELLLSPYIVSLPVPLPLSDGAVFIALANDYLTGVPDAFSLSFVCQINARVAASVLRFRECQVWRLISVALEQEEPHHHIEIAKHESPIPEIEPVHLSRSPEGSNSISSELGNFVGSYNSDLTLTTNYGAPRRNGSASSVANSMLGSSKESTRSVFLNKAPYGSDLKSSFTLPSQSHSGDTPEARDPIEIPRAETHEEAASSENTNNSRKSFQMRGPNEDFFIATSNTGLDKEKFSSSPYNDLDNENLNFLNNAAASYSSAGNLGSFAKKRMSFLSKESLNASFQSMHSKSPLGKQKLNLARDPNNLDRVDESSANDDLECLAEGTKEVKDSTLSKLTKALSKIQGAEEKLEQILPWHTLNIIQRSIEYALSQGDVIMSATLVLLFYDHYETVFPEKVLSKESCLECLGHYIEALRREGLFTIAVQVIKDAPHALKYDLSQFFCKDVDMRFYCCWCQKLLSNEASKAKYSAQDEKFGYWYCDECLRKQLNCVYCHEPCRGLSVVESLKCGHSGHFGCLQEWHLEENTEACPGGCD